MYEIPGVHGEQIAGTRRVITNGPQTHTILIAEMVSPLGNQLLLTVLARWLI